MMLSVKSGLRLDRAKLANKFQNCYISMTDRLFQSKGSRIRFNYSNAMLVSHSLGRMGQSHLFAAGEASPSPKRSQEAQQESLPSATSRPEKQYIKPKKEFRGLQLTTSKKVNAQRQKVTRPNQIPQPSMENQYFLQLRQLRQENNEMVRRLLFADEVQRQLQSKLQFLQNNLQLNLKPVLNGRKQTSQLEQAELKRRIEEEIRIRLEEEFRRQLEEILQENQHLKQQVMAQRGMNQSVQSRMRVFQQQATELTEIISSRSKEDKKMQQFICVLQKALAQKDKLNSNLQSENEALAEDRLSLTIKMNRQSETASQETFCLNNALELQQRNNVYLRQELANAHKQIAQCTTTITQLSLEIETSSQQKELLQKEINNLSFSLNQAAGEAESLQCSRQQLRKLHNQREQLSQAHGKRSALKQTLDEWLIKVAVMEEEIQRLQLLVLELKDKYQAVLSLITQENNSIEDISGKIKALNTSIGKTANSAGSFDKSSVAEINQLQQNTAQAQQKIAGLSRDNLHLKGLVDSLRTNEQLLLQELDWLRNQRQLVKSDFEQSKAYIVELEVQITILREAKQGKRQSQICVQKAVAVDKNIFKDQSKSLQEQNSRLKQQIDLLKVEYWELKENSEKYLIDLKARYEHQLGFKNQEYNDLMSNYQQQVHKLTQELKATCLLNQEKLKVGVQGIPNQLQIKKVLSEQLREQSDLEASTPPQKNTQEATSERQN